MASAPASALATHTRALIHEHEQALASEGALLNNGQQIAGAAWQTSGGWLAAFARATAAAVASLALSPGVCWRPNQSNSRARRRERLIYRFWRILSRA